MREFEVASYPGKTPGISVKAETNIIPKIKEQLLLDGVSQSRINNLRIIAGTILTTEQCAVKINNGGWIPLIKINEYYTVNINNNNITSLQFSSSVNLYTFSFYYL